MSKSVDRGQPYICFILCLRVPDNKCVQAIDHGGTPTIEVIFESSSNRSLFGHIFESLPDLLYEPVKVSCVIQVPGQW